MADTKYLFERGGVWNVGFRLPERSGGGIFQRSLAGPTPALAPALPPVLGASPCEEIAARNMGFTADVFVQRAGVGDLQVVLLFLAASQLE